MIYFDNAATTRVCDEAALAAFEQLKNGWANPSSLYALGARTEQTLSKARDAVARSLGAASAEIYFTSGGTEGNNLAVLGAARARKSWGNRVVVTGYEHPSVQNAVSALAGEGFEVVVVSPDKGGTVNAKEIVSAVTKTTALVAAMGVNNETGALIDVAGLADEVKAANPRTAFHCDWVQGYLKHPMDVSRTKIDTLTVSAHKICAPKGIGALYVRRGFNLAKTVYGGLQEGSLRPGTENVAFAAAFAAAVAAHRANGDLPGIKRFLIGELEAIGAVINSPENSSSYILNFSLVGYRSETVLHFLEQKGIYVSSGSACSRGAKSHTLAAAGLPDSIVDSAVRVSFSDGSTLGQAQIFINAIKEAKEVLAHR